MANRRIRLRITRTVTVRRTVRRRPIRVASYRPPLQQRPAATSDTLDTDETPEED